MMTEERAITILNQYPPNEFNVLAPETMTQITPWHQIVVSKVQLSSNKDDGDVYPQSGKLALTKIGLLKLADAAGIRFKTTQFQRYGDGSFQAAAIAEKQDPDGTWRQYPGSYYWDVTQRAEDIKEPNTKNGQAELRMIRTFAAQRAETGAMNRAIRNIIGVKATYHKSEIDKPFIVARISFNPFNDPMIRDAYRQALAVKLAENVALMRGDFDPDDPFGIEGPVSNRPTSAQLEAATETLRLLDGSPNDNEMVEGPEPEPMPELSEAKPRKSSGINGPGALLAAVNDETAGYYDSIPHLLAALRKVCGDGSLMWPPADDTATYLEYYQLLVDHARARTTA